MIGQLFINLSLLIPLAVVITYYDVRYRRIPNIFVLCALFSGLAANAAVNGWSGVRASVVGCFFAFGLMLLLHIFGALGAGDVKLFAAIGAVIGAHMVLPTFMVVVLTGGVLAIVTTLRVGNVRETAARVGYIFYSVFFNWQVPRLMLPADKSHTIPYGVAITLGSLISLAIFRA
jgi:prepilin peptidase CpaA